MNHLHMRPEVLKRIREQYPVGSTVEIIEMCDPYRDMPAGLRGTVTHLTLKTVCDFYGGDWSGVMDIDMDTCLWRPVCWFRAGGANDTTLERLSGLEDAEVMPRWLESMKSASPIVLTDTSEIRESCPVEYALYERLDARSIIASPFSPSPTGFLVIRNPSRYLNHPEALFIFAYVLHRALAQKNTMEREEIIEAMNQMEQSYDVYISFFRDLEIRTAGGTLTEQIINAPKTIQLVAYEIAKLIERENTSE